jgi:hypothetical protein
MNKLSPSHNNRRDEQLVWLFVAVAILLIVCGTILGIMSLYQDRVVVPGVDHPTTESDKSTEAPQAKDGFLDFQSQMGYEPNPQANAEFLESLGPDALFRDAAPGLFADPPPLPKAREENREGVFLYRFLRNAYATKYGVDWVVDQQLIGDCVGWGNKHGVDHATAIQYVLGMIADWKPVDPTSIYGLSRVEARDYPGDGKKPYAGYRDGSSGSYAAKGLLKFGCLFLREEYPFGTLTYSKDRARDWGAYGCGGKNDNGRADEICREHPIQKAALVKTFPEAVKAIESGYPVVVCSQIGFGDELPVTRDAQGFLRERSTWGHCMCFVGVRYDRPALLCLNSWGPKWVVGPKFPSDQPEGSFWIEQKTVEKMLRNPTRYGDLPDSFALSAVEGFPFRPISNSDWVQLRPQSSATTENVALQLVP